MWFGRGLSPFADFDSGLWPLFYFVPYIGSVILLCFLLRPGTVGSNRFGADPKQRPFDLASVDAVFS